MTLQDILNSNLSDKHKLELITFMQKGGLTPDQEEPKKSERHKTIIPTETIIIGDKEYDVAVADTPELRKKGLEPYGYLREDEGMLFIFDEETTDYFTMKNCSIDLDIVFVNSEGEVIQVSSVKAYTSKPVTCKQPYQFVLEVNINSNIEVGDTLSQESDEFDDSEKEIISKNKMLVLDSNGDVQMKLHGGERIFSRIFTRKLIKAAIVAYRSDSDLSYRKVGRLVLKELDAQDNRQPEYTKLEE